MLKFCFYVPESHLETVKKAVFAAGAGRIGDYECCCWQIEGTGQFKPLTGSSPFLGAQGVVETVSEYRVEMVLEEASLDLVLLAFREAHPYEEPAFDVIRTLDVKLP